MVKAKAWLASAAAALTAAGCEDAAFDARCLLEDVGGAPRGILTEETVLPAALAALDKALARRMAGEPLQYILGSWDFLDLTLAVGEGVLIPRQDTECLCETVARQLQGRVAPRVLDLCAGTGCVGLGVARLVPGARVTAVELSQQALPYLRENIVRYPALDVTAVQADVLTAAADWEGGWDAIVSNPPYIPSAELPDLMREVQHEPSMALDGDSDGLKFYRVLAAQWSRKLAPGGVLAVEIGSGQDPEVTGLFAAAGLQDIRVFPDLAGIPRVVMGKK